ncbi:hypothetical protein OEZ86_014044 [Tetradesmus obliquus]|nr:hypothetical protein OEZ86_014044 [Tetradesmus obliquus]
MAETAEQHRSLRGQGQPLWKNLSRVISDDDATLATDYVDALEVVVQAMAPNQSEDQAEADGSAAVEDFCTVVKARAAAGKKGPGSNSSRPKTPRQEAAADEDPISVPGQGDAGAGTSSKAGQRDTSRINKAGGGDAQPAADPATPGSGGKDSSMLQAMKQLFEQMTRSSPPAAADDAASSIDTGAAADQLLRLGAAADGKPDGNKDTGCEQMDIDTAAGDAAAADAAAARGGRAAAEAGGEVARGSGAAADAAGAAEGDDGTEDVGAPPPPAVMARLAAVLRDTEQRRAHWEAAVSEAKARRDRPAQLSARSCLQQAQAELQQQGGTLKDVVAQQNQVLEMLARMQMEGKGGSGGTAAGGGGIWEALARALHRRAAEALI